MQINLVSVTGSNTPPTYGTTGAKYIVVGSSPTTGSAFVNHAGELAETVGDGTYKFMGKASMSQHTYVAGGVFYTHNGTQFIPLQPIEQSVTFAYSDGTAADAAQYGMASARMTAGGIYVGLSKTMHITRVNGTVTMGSDFGATHAGALIIWKVGAAASVDLATWSGKNLGDIVGISSTIAVDVAGEERVLVGWRNDVGSPGPLATAVHNVTISFYFTDS